MLKKLFVSCFLLISICANAHSAVSVEAISGYVIDGDTFAAIVKLENDVQVSVRVRILGIDAPEIHGECESEIQRAFLARDRLMELLPEGSTIWLSSIKDDKYLGRIDAYVKMSDGVDVSTIMLKEKLAVPYGGGKRGGWCP
ncbi:MAG: thermonuclease family protein [Alphaproteobacteria bacterium]|nr:thermonuclease family protein [Alphaproteobacteria bacterium]